MGALKEEFANVRMRIDYYHSLDEEIKSNMELRSVHAEGWQKEYEKDEKWLAQKELTNSNYKEYMKLKKIEFEIRNK